MQFIWLIQFSYIAFIPQLYVPQSWQHNSLHKYCTQIIIRIAEYAKFPFPSSETII